LGLWFGALRIIGVFREWQSRGKIIETKCNGFAASAGFMLLAAGNKGYRSANDIALLMWHEIQTFKMFDFGDVSDKEEEAETLRFFQDNNNEWLASVSDMTKQEIDAKIDKLEFWMSGKEAYEFGFVDTVY